MFLITVTIGLLFHEFKKRFFSDKMKKSTIKIPVTRLTKKPKVTCDCPTKVFQIKSWASTDNSMTGIKSLDLFNSRTITLKPKETRNIIFEKTIITSLPAICILYGSQFLYKLGISYEINVIQTNDTYANIFLHNHTRKIIHLPPNHLHVICSVVLPGKINGHHLF